MFPTGVGMNRLFERTLYDHDRVPHRRGDEPILFGSTPFYFPVTSKNFHYVKKEAANVGRVRRANRSLPAPRGGRHRRRAAPLKNLSAIRGTGNRGKLPRGSLAKEYFEVRATRDGYRRMRRAREKPNRPRFPPSSSAVNSLSCSLPRNPCRNAISMVYSTRFNGFNGFEFSGRSGGRIAVNLTELNRNKPRRSTDHRKYVIISVLAGAACSSDARPSKVRDGFVPRESRETRIGVNFRILRERPGWCWKNGLTAEPRRSRRKNEKTGGNKRKSCVSAPKSLRSLSLSLRPRICMVEGVVEAEATEVGKRDVLFWLFLGVLCASAVDVFRLSDNCC